MSYIQQLTYQLRLRGQTETEITETLREVHAHGAASDADRVAEFGTPERYAEQFEKRKRRTLGGRMVLVSVLVTVACYAIYIGAALWLQHGFSPSLRIVDYVPRQLVSLGAIPLLTLGVVGGYLIDRFRPAAPEPVEG